MASVVRVIMNTDGGVRTGGFRGPDGGKTGVAAIAAVMKDEETGEKVFAQGMLLDERVTVNEAEYSAIIFGLHNALELGATQVVIRTDSQLVAHQITGEWAVKQTHLQEYLDEVHSMLEEFEDYTVEWIPREQNQHADMIARVILDEEMKTE